MTSTNICKTNEFEHSIFLKAHCGCSSDDHIQSIIIEADDHNVSLEMYTKAYTEYHGNLYDAPISERLGSWYRSQKKKLKWIFSILFKGYIEVETCFLFENETSIDDYLTAIQEAKEKLKNAQSNIL